MLISCLTGISFYSSLILAAVKITSKRKFGYFQSILNLTTYVWKPGDCCSTFMCTDATISAFGCLWALCVHLCVREGVCWWSCLKESSSDGAWKPCSAAVLPVHRQIRCWAHNTRSALTPAHTLSSMNLRPSLLFFFIHFVCLAKPLHSNLSLNCSLNTICFSYLNKL